MACSSSSSSSQENVNNKYQNRNHPEEETGKILMKNGIDEKPMEFVDRMKRVFTRSFMLGSVGTTGGFIYAIARPGSNILYYVGTMGVTYTVIGMTCFGIHEGILNGLKLNRGTENTAIAAGALSGGILMAGYSGYPKRILTGALSFAIGASILYNATDYFEQWKIEKANEIINQRRLAASSSIPTSTRTTTIQNNNHPTSNNNNNSNSSS